jgi:hypothetical protein
MKNPVWLVALAAALLVVFGGGYWLGERTGVVALDGGSTSGNDLVGTDEGGAPGQTDVIEDGAFNETDEVSPDTAPGGLEVADGGYVLQPITRSLVVNKQTEYAFRLVGPDGAPVTKFERPYGKDVSLLVARRDLSCYAIAQPVLGQDGVWRAPLTLPAAGQYRMVVDFTPAGSNQSVLLGVDVPAPGSYSLAPQPRPNAPADVDGYRVVLTGDLEAGRASSVQLTISRDGKPVTDLAPHMASYGHLIVLRDGDMAFLRVTAAGRAGDGRTRPGPGVGFEVQVPTKGTYGMYFEFRHAGKLHSATFTTIAS